MSVRPIGEIIDRIGFCRCGEPLRYIRAIHAGLKVLWLPEAERHKARQDRWQRVEGWLCGKASIPADMDPSWTILYLLDKLDLSEHVTSIRGAWLTEDGEALLEFLDKASAEDDLGAWDREHDLWMENQP
jgi:hypothetical protein